MPLSGKNLTAFIIICVFGLITISGIVYYGLHLQSPGKQTNPYFKVEFVDTENQSPVGEIPTPNLQDLSFFHEFSYLFENTISSNLSKTIIQIVLIMLLARLIGLYFRKIGQPTVIGEIIAGILIGPSVLGLIFPDFHSFLFSYDQVEILEILSNLGLILFLFVIGMEIDLTAIKKKTESTILITLVSLFIPLVFGFILAYLLFPSYAPNNITFSEFGLFLGISLGITAYPLLERILHERGLSRSGIGNLSMTASGYINLFGWILLSIVLAMINSRSWVGLSITLGLSIIYGLLLVFVIQPFLKRLSEIYVSRENLTKTAMAIIFVFLFAGALITELIGLHAMIGAFFFGIIMPSNHRLKSLIAERIDYIALVFLLPIFFALTGLRTDLSILATTPAWKLLGAVLLFAILSKLLSVGATSRFIGLSWKDSISLGFLMNTRGLIPLIAINLGFQIGVISIPLFSVLVLTIVITTLITSPALLNLQIYFDKKNTPSKPLEAFKRILISFAQPTMGVALIRLSNFLFGINKDKTQITAVHITPTESLTPDELKEYKKKTFADIENLVDELNFPIEMVHRTTENITYEILNQAKISKSRFLLIGAAKSLFTKNILGGRIRPVLSYAPCNVGVLLDNGLTNIKKVLVLKKTTSGLGYEKMIHYLIREHGSKKINIHPVAMFTTLKHEDFSGYQLVIIEVELWKEREEFLEVEIQNLDASILIMQFK